MVQILPSTRPLKGNAALVSGYCGTRRQQRQLSSALSKTPTTATTTTTAAPVCRNDDDVYYTASNGRTIFENDSTKDTQLQIVEARAIPASSVVVVSPTMTNGMLNTTTVTCDGTIPTNADTTTTSGSKTQASVLSTPATPGTATNTITTTTDTNTNANRVRITASTKQKRKPRPKRRNYIGDKYYYDKILNGTKSNDYTRLIDNCLTQQQQQQDVTDTSTTMCIKDDDNDVVRYQEKDGSSSVKDDVHLLPIVVDNLVFDTSLSRGKNEGVVPSIVSQQPQHGTVSDNKSNSCRNVDYIVSNRRTVLKNNSSKDVQIQLEKRRTTASSSVAVVESPTNADTSGYKTHPSTLSTTSTPSTTTTTTSTTTTNDSITDANRNRVTASSRKKRQPRPKRSNDYYYFIDRRSNDTMLPDEYDRCKPYRSPPVSSPKKYKGNKSNNKSISTNNLLKEQQHDDTGTGTTIRINDDNDDVVRYQETDGSNSVKGDVQLAPIVLVNPVFGDSPLTGGDEGVVPSTVSQQPLQKPLKQQDEIMDVAPTIYDEERNDNDENHKNEILVSLLKEQLLEKDNHIAQLTMQIESLQKEQQELQGSQPSSLSLPSTVSLVDIATTNTKHLNKITADDEEIQTAITFMKDYEKQHQTQEKNCDEYDNNNNNNYNNGTYLELQAQQPKQCEQQSTLDHPMMNMLQELHDKMEGMEVQHFIEIMNLQLSMTKWKDMANELSKELEQYKTQQKLQQQQVDQQHTLTTTTQRAPKLYSGMLLLQTQDDDQDINHNKRKDVFNDNAVTASKYLLHSTPGLLMQQENDLDIDFSCSKRQRTDESKTITHNTPLDLSNDRCNIVSNNHHDTKHTTRKKNNPIIPPLVLHKKMTYLGAPLRLIQQPQCETTRNHCQQSTNNITDNDCAISHVNVTILSLDTDTDDEI